MSGATGLAAPTLSRRTLLKGLTLGAVSVHVLGPVQAQALAAQAAADGGSPAVGGRVAQLAVLALTLQGPPRGRASTNTLRRDTRQGPVWLAADGRKLFIPEIGDEVVVGYVDPFLGVGGMRHTTTLSAFEHELRSNFGDQTFLEVVRRLQARTA